MAAGVEFGVSAIKFTFPSNLDPPVQGKNQRFCNIVVRRLSEIYAAVLDKFSSLPSTWAPGHLQKQNLVPQNKSPI